MAITNHGGTTDATDKTGAVAPVGLQAVVRRIEELEARISKLENPIAGYRCQICGITRSANWFIYEVEKSADNWVTPCCAECARKFKSRGPYPPNAEFRSGGTGGAD